MQKFVVLALLVAAVSADGDHAHDHSHAHAPSNSYGVPDTPPGPYSYHQPETTTTTTTPAPAPAPAPEYSAPQQPTNEYNAPAPADTPAPEAPSNAYGVPDTPPGPYSYHQETTTTTTTTPAPAPQYEYNAPQPAAPQEQSPPSQEYSVPETAPGPYGYQQQEESESTQHVPGQLITTNHHIQYYAPLFKTVYVPVASEYQAPAPAPGYGVPAPSNSYGVPETAPGPYGSSSAAQSPSAGYYAPAQQATRQKVGDALVRNWLTQTVLSGGGRITTKKVRDGYGYKTVTNEEWDDQVPNYNFGYDVTGPYGHADTSATESRNGGATQGRYTVKLPDGRTQVVSYTVDQNGYRPTVTYV